MSIYKTVHLIFLILGLAALAGIIFYEISLLYLFLIVIIWLTIIFYGSSTLSAQFFIESTTSFDTKEKLIAITFDDGLTEFTPKVLQILDEHDAKAGFFCIGRQIEKYPEIFKMIVEKGHAIGNHTYNHSPRMGFYSQAQVLEEIVNTDEIIFSKMGIKTPYFRPPFGITNPNIARALKISGHKVIGWNIRSFDTFFKDENVIFNRIVKQIKPGSIILLHDTSEKTVIVLDRLLKYLMDRNYQCVRFDKMLKREE